MQTKIIIKKWTKENIYKERFEELTTMRDIEMSDIEMSHCKIR